MIKNGLVIPMRSEESNFNSLFCHTHSPVGKGIMKKTALLFLSETGKPAGGLFASVRQVNGLSLHAL